MMFINDAKLKFNGSFSKRMRTTAIIMHHSGVTVLQSVQTVHEYYLHKVDPDGSTYVGIGYHYYIRKDGSIWQGRPEPMRGGHAGIANDYSIGICCEGDFTKEKMSGPQYNSLLELTKDIIKRNGKLEFLKHSDVMATACPGGNFPFDILKNAVLNPPKPVMTPPSNPAPPTIPVGSKVKVNTAAQKYATGESIADFVKGSVYTVIQSETDRVLLGGIMSWVKASDVTVAGNVATPPPVVKPVVQTPAPVTSSIKVGNKVKMTGKKYATGQDIPFWAKLRTYDVLDVSSTTLLVGIGKAVTGWIRKSECKKV